MGEEGPQTTSGMEDKLDLRMQLQSWNVMMCALPPTGSHLPQSDSDGGQNNDRSK